MATAFKVLLCVGSVLLSSISFGLATACAMGAEPEKALQEGSAVVKTLADQSNSWSDYSCITELHNFRPDKTTITRARFLYRKGPELRIEVLGGGFRDGSVILRCKDGRIKARGGAWLGGIQMNLEPDSRMLAMPNGVSAVKADLPELYSMLESELRNGVSARYIGTPIVEPSTEQKVVVLELENANKQIVQKIYLSPEQRLPVRWDSFEDGKLRTSTYFSELKINNGFADDTFQL